MARVVISFVGRAGQALGYAFPGEAPDDGPRLQRRFFLPVLLAWLARQGEPADSVVVIGTATSHWGCLERELERLRPDLPEGVEPPEYRRVELAEKTNDAYTDTLQTIRSAVGTSNQVVLDLSQGMRHQPLIALLAAIYLDRLPANQAVTIEHVFSASVPLDDDGRPEQNPVEVRDLRPILDLAAWVFALGAFEGSGDTGVFTELLAKDNDPTAVALLCEGAALERATRIGAAANAIKAGLSGIEHLGAEELKLGGAGAPFGKDLYRALAWVEGDSFAQHCKLARRHLTHRDWPRAATHMFEACRIRLVECVDKNKVTSGFDEWPQFKQRHCAANNYGDKSNPTWFAHIRNRNTAAFDQRVVAFKTLTAIRNALAHAGEPDTAVQAVVADPGKLHEELLRLYEAMLADKQPFP